MEEQKTSAGQGLGIAGLVIGIMAVILALIPCIGWIAIIPGVIALALSLVAFSQANKGNGSKGVIIGALVVSIIATSIGLIQIVFFAAVTTEGGNIMNKIEKVAKEFEDEFEGEYGKDFEEAMDDVEESMKKIGDDLEETMEKLEEDMEEVDDRTKELSDEEKAGKMGKAAGKAVKEFVKEMKDTADTK
ncbi:MAG: hypothetical protein IMY71_01320 [Bacteroidetes bacterium]|nr:hypothetical protein [Bacteroidota bacterium]